MSNSTIFTDPNNALLKDRLARISETLRNLQLSTAEDYQAEVYSAVNAVLSLGIAMTPFEPVSAEGPAVVGDVVNNYQILNNDAQDIANELLRIEDSAATLFNLAATSQNQLRQQIREQVYGSNKQRYSEEFINSNGIANSTANIDYNAGLATNNLIDETPQVPTITIGANSVGAIDSASSLANLNDGRVDTALVWNGSTLELVLTFSSPVIINRLTLDMDTYNGIEIDTFITSPDGTLIEDVLVDLGVDRIELDGTSNKFSGDVIIDFPPRHAKMARLVIFDRVGEGLISFRELTVSSRRYTASGQVTSKPINFPTGEVQFTSTENTFIPYVSTTHQISYDGVSFSAISPGDIINITTVPYYYRAVLERSASRFENPQGPLVQSPLDPIGSPNYTLASTTTTPLGNGIIDRSILVNDVTGPIVLRETPLPNTLVIQEGSVVLSQSAGDYTFSDLTINFPTGVTGISISYQTTSLGAAAIKDREEYYTALLYEAKFEAV